MEKTIYKPYKKGLTTWSNIPSRKREDYGRVIVCIEIGKKLTVDERTEKVLDEEPVCEDIFLDILKGIVKDNLGYKTSSTFAYEPKMVISYGGRLVFHNDRISGYVDHILKALNSIDYNLITDALINFVANENVSGKYDSHFRTLVNMVNAYCNINYSPTLIGLVVKEYFEESRTASDDEDDIHYLPYEELLNLAGNVWKNKGKNNISEKEIQLKEELLYRFIQGTLIGNE